MISLLLTVSVCLACLFLGMGLLEGLRTGAAAFERRYLSRTGEKLEAAYLEYTPRMLFAAGCASAGLIWLGVSLVSGNIILGIPFGGGAFFAPEAWLFVIRKRRIRKFDLQLPDALASIANSLRAGLSIPQAFESVSRGYPPPISQEIGLMLKEISLGQDMEDAVEAMARRTESREAGLLAIALGAMKNIGGNLSDVLEKIALTLRARQRLEEKVRALTAQGKIQGLVIGLMPAALGGVLYVLDPGMIGNLFLDPLGWGILTIVFFLEGVGIFFLRRVASIDI